MSIPPQYLSKDKLESKAEEILAEYRGGAHLESPAPLDVDSFAEFHLEATIDYHRLSADGSVLGMSVFQELSIPVVDHADCSSDVVFPSRTIVIDHQALSGSPESRLRFTVAHECAHLILHRNIYYRDPLMKCSGNTGYRPFTTNTEGVRSDKVDRAEFQANYLGAALLMPRDPFSQMYRTLVPGSWYDLAERRKKAVVCKLADTFETSLQATSLRIKNLKLAA